MSLLKVDNIENLSSTVNVSTDDLGLVPALKLINGIKNLIPIVGTSMLVKGFYANTDTQGFGHFYYDPTLSKTKHNGGTVIAPEAIAAWDGTPTNVATLLNWTGTGNGCYVRVFDVSNGVHASYFGMLVSDDGNNLLALPDATASINAAMKYCNSRYSEITNEGYYGTTNFKLILPNGNAKTSAVIQILRGVDVKSVGTTLFQCSTYKAHNFMDCLTERLFDFEIEGVKLDGYQTCFRVKNDDVTDHSQWRFKRCGFKDVDVGIDTVNYTVSRSVILTIEDCKTTIGVKQMVKSFCDMTHIVGGWFTHDQNSPCITFAGRLCVEGGIYVPIYNDPSPSKTNKMCWYQAELADEPAGGSFRGCRFGAEFGGATVLYVKSNAALNEGNGLASGSTQQFNFSGCQLSSSNVFDPDNLNKKYRGVVVFGVFNNGGVSFESCTISTDLGPAALGYDQSRVVVDYGNVADTEAPHNFVIQFDESTWRSANNGANRSASNKMMQYIGNAKTRSIFKNISAHGHLLVGLTTDTTKNKSTFKVKLGRSFTNYTYPILFDVDIGQLGTKTNNAFRHSRYAGYRCSIVGGRDLTLGINVYKINKTLLYSHDGGTGMGIGADIVSMHFGTGDTGQDYINADGNEPNGTVDVTIVWGEETEGASTGLAKITPIFDQFSQYVNGNDVLS
jgi:hypothetical protein